MKFKAIVIDNQNEKFTREVKEIDKEILKDGNVLVKVDYSSLNYKDAKEIPLYSWHRFFGNCRGKC